MTAKLQQQIKCMYVKKKKKKRHFKLVLTESVFYNINVTIYSTVIMCMTDVQIEIQILDQFQNGKYNMVQKIWD